MRRDMLTATALTTWMVAGLWPAAASAQNGAATSWTGFYVGATAGAEGGGKGAFLDVPDTD